MIAAIFQLTRPFNVLIAMLSVFIGAAITGAFLWQWPLLLACLSVGLIIAAGNTINDYFDIDIDRINKPSRPLPAGKISPTNARRAAGVEFVLGMILGAFVSWPLLAMAAFFSALIIAYGALLKRTVFWGNLTVSLSSGATFVYGGLAMGFPGKTLLPGAMAFLFHLGREIIKDMEDARGDSQNNALTLPVRYGMKLAVRCIQITFILLGILTLWPYLSGIYGEAYFFVIAAGVWPVLLFTLFRLQKTTEPTHLRFLSVLLKVDMLLGLLAIYLG